MLGSRRLVRRKLRVVGVTPLGNHFTRHSDHHDDKIQRGEEGRKTFGRVVMTEYHVERGQRRGHRFSESGSTTPVALPAAGLGLA